MKLGFVVETVSNLKILGPLLDVARVRGLETAVLIPEWRKGKPYDTATEGMFEERVAVYEAGKLAEAVSAASITELVLLNPYRNFVADVPKLASVGIDVFSLDYFVNSVYVSAANDNPMMIEEALGGLSGRFVASEYWRDLEFRVRAGHAKYSERFMALGNPLIDVFESLNGSEARAKLGLLSGKPIVSIFTPNIRDHQAHFFYGLGTKFHLKRLAKMLREYCDGRGYQLMVKSREKQWDAQPFLAVADAAIYDLEEQHHPSTSALLIAASSLAVHFGSMMVLEAAGAHVPSIAIEPAAIDRLHNYMRPEVRPMLAEEMLGGNPKSLFNFGKVSQLTGIGVKREEFAEMADQMIRSVKDGTAEYDKFNEKFSGWIGDKSASERILSYIQGGKTANEHQRVTELVAADKISHT